MKLAHCRWCGSKLERVVSLGNMPLVNYFPKPSEISKEKTYPLDFCVCPSCGLAQLGESIPPDKIFKTYHYITGASKPLITQLQLLASSIQKKCKLTHHARVLDVGSNDGTLLFAFKRLGIQGIGIEPASDIASLARKRGITTINAFFSDKEAKRIVHRFGQFEVITATHVLANIVDIHDFLRGIGRLLTPDGVFVVEVGSLEEMLANGQFDAIYHEHYSYFSLDSLSRILADYGFSVVDSSFPSAQGGSLRIMALRTLEVRKKYLRYRRITNSDYAKFTQNVAQFRSEFRGMLRQHKGKTIVGFGAPAKAVTLLNYCGIGLETIQAIVDSTPVKQGRLIPGVHIPIYPEERLARMKSDVVVILAWNYQEEIMKKLTQLMKKNIPVIVPFPKLEQIEVQ
jgi:SAM-dependent methyltransferase